MIRKLLITTLIVRLAKFIKSTVATIAVEFAILLFPFVLLLVAIIETGYVALTTTVIDGAVASASRQVRTGIIQGSGDPIAEFRKVLCAEVNLVINCTLLQIDVQNFKSFPDPGNLPPPGNTFLPGGAEDYTLVRVSYNWKYITPFLQELTQPGGNRYIATAIFKIEPFE